MRHCEYWKEEGSVRRDNRLERYLGREDYAVRILDVDGI